jgi:hypothetical protein
MYLWFVFLLTMRLTAGLRLSRREETWKTAEISPPRSGPAGCCWWSATSRRIWPLPCPVGRCPSSYTSGEIAVLLDHSWTIEVSQARPPHRALRLAQRRWPGEQRADRVAHRRPRGTGVRQPDAEPARPAHRQRQAHLRSARRCRLAVDPTTSGPTSTSHRARGSALRMVSA